MKYYTLLYEVRDYKLIEKYSYTVFVITISIKIFGPLKRTLGFKQINQSNTNKKIKVIIPTPV